MTRLKVPPVNKGYNGRACNRVDLLKSSQVTGDVDKLTAPAGALLKLIHKGITYD